MPSPSAPLDGVRVLDMSRLLPGPFASLLLSDLGAEVTKLEAPEGGDYLRYFPPLLDDGNGAAFHALNRGKRSVTLDIKSDAGRDALLAMLPDYDVLLESFRPGVLERLRLAPQTLQAAHPGLIVCRISGYGADGPMRHRAGHDLNYVARAGLLSMSAHKAPLPAQAADIAGGAWPAALQIIAALYARDAREAPATRNQSARAAVIEVNMSAHVADLAFLPRTEAMFGAEVNDGAHLLAGAVPCYDVYPAREGHLAVGALEPKFWFAFCDAVGLPDCRDGGLDRGAAGAKIRERVAERLVERTAAEWMTTLGDVDCCVEALHPPGEGGTVCTVRIGTDEVTLPRPVLDLAHPKAAPAPALGAHNPLTRGD